MKIAKMSINLPQQERDDIVDAGAWVRVSSGGQDEANQVPDVEHHCDEHHYRIVKRYELNDRSASKGEQQARLEEMLTDMRLGIVKVVVCWHSDRMERRGPGALFKLLRQTREAGGRIESVKEPMLGATDLPGETMTATGAIMSHQYSVHLAGQVRIAHARIRANGALMPGGIPWGYVVVGPKYDKRIVPSDECRKYAPQIFQRCIDGDSCRTIALWLDSEGVRSVTEERDRKRKIGVRMDETGESATEAARCIDKHAGPAKPWNERSVWQVIKNMTYAGRRQDEGSKNAAGKPTRKNRTTLMKCEAVVSLDTWRRANEALAERPGRGPGVNGTRQPKAMLEGLKCARCEHSPMYRIRSGGGMYYRCTGRGANRKGCGNMIPLDALDVIVAARFLTWDEKPHQIRSWTEGEDWDADIESIAQDIREIDPVDAVTKPDVAARRAELERQLADYASRGVVDGHWAYTDTGMTEGEFFYALSADGRREYLKGHDIRAAKVTDDAGREGVRLVIDGEDHGVFRYPPKRGKQREASQWL
jgi:Resolvase, N terminal domain/Recombinase/Recombinase zinc beta ribbon domain